MDEKTAEAIQREAAAGGETPVSVTDTIPPGAATVGGKPATPVNAATMRFLQAIAQVEPDIDEYEQAMFALYCRVKGADQEGRRALWRLARAPAKLWDAFTEWMQETSLEDLTAMMKDHFPDWLEVSNARRIIGDDETEPDQGNGTGSRS